MKLGKIHLKSLILLTSLVFVKSCQLNSNSNIENDDLKKYFSEHFNLQLENYDLLCVITEAGCMNCNTKYVNKLEPFLNRERILFLVTTKGTYFDISNFTFTERKNIVFDFHPPKNIDLITKSNLIFLKNGLFDKEIPINSENLDLVMKTLDNF